MIPDSASRLTSAILLVLALLSGCDRVPSRAPLPASTPWAGARDTAAGQWTNRSAVSGEGLNAQGHSGATHATVLMDALDQADIRGLAGRIVAGEAPASRTRMMTIDFDDHTLGGLRARIVSEGHGPPTGKARRIRARVDDGRRAYLGGSLRLTRAGGRESRASTPLMAVTPGHGYALTYRMAVYRYSHKKTRYQRKPRVGKPILELFDLRGLPRETIETLEKTPGALAPYRVEAADDLDPPGMDRGIPWMALGDTFLPGARTTHFRIIFAVTATPLLPGQSVSAEVWYDDIVLTDLAGTPADRHPVSGAPGFGGTHPLQTAVQLPHPMRPNATEKRMAIYAPAPSAITFPVRVPAAGVLRLGLGLLPEFTAGAGDGHPVSFAVTVTDEDGTRQTLYEWTQPPGKPLKTWKDVVVKLGHYSGRLIRLTLETRGRPAGDLSLPEALSRRPEGGMMWSFPVVDAPKHPGKTVVLVVWDTVPASATSLVRAAPDITPRLVTLASRGVTFDRALATSSWTLPSFASILTGTHPFEHDAGELDPQTPRGKRPLPLSIPTLASRLRKAGWETRAWINNPYLMHHFGLDRGFSDYIDYDAREMFRASDKAVAQAVEYLSKPRGYNRFVFFHFMDAHGPYLPHAEYRTRFCRMFREGKVQGESLGQFYRSILMNKVHLTSRQKKGYRELYDAVVAYTDHQTGRLFDAIEGTEAEALFIVTADHGEEFWEHGYYEHGHTMYDELLHVPLVMARTGAMSAGRQPPNHIGTPVSLEDVVPTILSYAGGSRDAGALAPVPPLAPPVSLLPALSGGEPPGARTFASSFTLYGFQRLAIERDGWKLIVNQQGIGGPNARTGKPIAPVELYHIASDPGERRNLALRRPNLTATLLDDLAERYTVGQRGRLTLLFLGNTRYGLASKVSVSVELKGGPRWKKAVHDIVWPSRGHGSGRLDIKYREGKQRSVVQCAFSSWKALLTFEPAIGSGPAHIQVEVDGRPVPVEVVEPDGDRKMVSRPTVVEPAPLSSPLPTYLEQDLHDTANTNPRVVVLYDARRDQESAMGEDAEALEAQLRALGYVE